MKNNLITAFENRVFKDQSKQLPQFRPGDTVRVMYKIQEGADQTKFRIQPFEGVVIRKKKGAVAGSFTVRKMGANNIGVERVFPLCSPMIDAVEVIASGIVRRSRLFYLRELSGKAARIRSRYHGRRGDVATPAAEQAVAEQPVAETEAAPSTES